MRHALPFAALTAFTALAAAPPASAAELELVPMLGIADLGADDEDIEYDAGIVAGLSFGGRLARLFSLHGQFSMHPLSIENSDGDGFLVTVGVAPLFNVLDNDSVRLQLGPIIGGFVMSETYDRPAIGFGPNEITLSITGIHVGLQFGAFFKLSDTAALGPWIQYGQMIATEACISSGGTETCGDVDDDDGLSLLQFCAAAMFTF